VPETTHGKTLMTDYHVYDKNNKDITDEVIKHRVIAIAEEIQQFMGLYGVKNCCYLNLTLLQDAVVDYFEDVARMKSFHEIEHIDIVKIFSYETYWLMRNKPIQIIDEKAVPKELRHINENVFAAWLLKNIATELERRFKPEIQIDGLTDKLMNHPLMVELLSNLYYHFRFRHYTPQSLLILVESFMNAAEFTLQIT
jgi:hypothetical protein